MLTLKLKITDEQRSFMKCNHNNAVAISPSLTWWTRSSSEGRILYHGETAVFFVLRYKHDSAQSKKIAKNSAIDTMACKSALLQLVAVSGFAVNAHRCCCERSLWTLTVSLHRTVKNYDFLTSHSSVLKILSYIWASSKEKVNQPRVLLQSYQWT